MGRGYGRQDWIVENLQHSALDFVLWLIEGMEGSK